MASRGGPMVDGTDGRDFMHRQRVANQYQLSAVNKSRLRICIFFHILLFFIMLLKLSPLFLDRLDIFVLEIEELKIPKPLAWEYWWCASIVAALFGLSAIRKNNIQTLNIYLACTLFHGVLPVLWGLWYYFSDVLEYLTTHSAQNIQTWQGYPYGLLWYAFLVVALQVHGFSMYFAFKLITAWSLKGSSSSSSNAGSDSHKKAN